jgi:hypothetical protein
MVQQSNNHHQSILFSVTQLMAQVFEEAVWLLCVAAVIASTLCENKW